MMKKIVSSLVIANCTRPKHNLGRNVQGFYSPDKFKLKEYSRSFPGLIYFFSRIDLNDSTCKLKYTRVNLGISCNMAENLAH